MKSVRMTVTNDAEALVSGRFDRDRPKHALDSWIER